MQLLEAVAVVLLLKVAVVDVYVRFVPVTGLGAPAGLFLLLT